MTRCHVLGHASFAPLLAARAISVVGDGVSTIALAWLVIQTTGSGAAMGVVLAVRVIPTLVLLLVGGVAVDRFSRHRIMVVSDGGRAIVMSIVALAAATDHATVPLLAASAAASGALDAFFAPAFVAVLPQLIQDADRRARMNAVAAVVERFGALMGPLAGGAIVATIGIAPSFALDASSFVASALLVDFSRRHSGIALTYATTEARSFLDELKVGVATVTRLRWIAITIVVAGITELGLSGPMEAVMPVLVAKVYGNDVRLLGLIGSAVAFGAISGALLGARLTTRRRGKVIYMSWIALAIATASMGLGWGPGPVIAASVVVGAGQALLGLAWISALQEFVAGDQLGRVFSVDALGSYALLPVAYFLAGSTADAFGPQLVFVCGGTGAALILAAAFAIPVIRNLD